LPCLSPDLGFPEFESFHLIDFSIKAQFSKSVASTIPPRPHWSLRMPPLQGINTPLIYSTRKGKILQQDAVNFLSISRQARSGTIVKNSVCAQGGKFLCLFKGDRASLF